MGRYITTKADFTLRRKHKKGPSGTTIYENDYTTINPMPNTLKGEYVIGDSNFVFTSRLGINAQKKHVRGKFVQNPSGSMEDGGAWTMETMIDSGVTNETKIRLKPNYTSIKDFACYGSAVKLVQGTVNGVITDFPAEMYLSRDQITFYKPESGSAGYSFNDDNGVGVTGNILYNEYAIDITTKNIRPESVYNPLRYLSLCGSSYTYIDTNENVYDFVSFTVESKASGQCYGGKSVWIDHLADVTLKFSREFRSKEVKIEVYKDYHDDAVYYTYTVTGGEKGAHIRPKKQIIEEYFRNCDDFTAVLLERMRKPIYTATFETPRETETGYVYDMVNYSWPTFHGGYNPDLSGSYVPYVEGLMRIAEFYDEYFSDNMWRSLTHEAIKTLDWTYVSTSDGDTEDMSAIDTSRIEPITKIYGRQFDDLKRYADGIKSINAITYNQKSNTPDYTLTDVLANSGWEARTLKITSDNGIYTDPLYSGLTSGYTASDANNEFFRRLKLNSQYLFSIKGTRKGLDTMLGMLGFKPEDYRISEYVYVFKGTEDGYPHFCNETKDKDCGVRYPLAKDVATVNKYKVNFNSFDPYGDYCGIPVAEIGYTVEQGDGEPIDCSYVVPWFSYGKKYDDGLYFQSHGGWGKREELDIESELTSAATIEPFPNVPLYMETQARLKFAKDFDELLQQAYASSNLYDVFYVTDISRIEDMYSSGDSEVLSAASHYFVLEDEELNQFLGYDDSIDSEPGKYGWRSISNKEIQDPNGYSAGTLVLYLESIQDDTTGNNPHIGGGTYDDGTSYISGMSEIFAYSLANKNFIGIDDSACTEIAKLMFGYSKYEDNRKCWFFSDDYNKKEDKDDTGTTITFKEVDITENVCDLHNCNDKEDGCNTGKSYDIVDLLNDEEADNNKEIGIGSNAPSYFSNTDVYYNRISDKLSTFNPEHIEDSGKNGEAAANSVVNVKNLDIVFSLRQFDDVDDDKAKKAFKKYIETTVIPYLTQMLPSTSILSFNFE